MVLVVDDDAGARASAVRLVKAYGHEAAEAPDGIQALALLRTTLPRLVILDYEMPIMNGLQVLEAIRSDPKTAVIPVVLFTGSFAPGLKEKALAAGAQDVLTKGSADWARLLDHIQR